MCVKWWGANVIVFFLDKNIYIYILLLNSNTTWPTHTIHIFFNNIPHLPRQVYSILISFLYDLLGIFRQVIGIIWSKLILEKWQEHYIYYIHRWAGCDECNSYAEDKYQRFFILKRWSIIATKRTGLQYIRRELDNIKKKKLSNFIDDFWVVAVFTVPFMDVTMDVLTC